ncbi:alpha/beta hydrolase [Gimesia panareensis]|uniref:Esterase n=1 Tax=Gimesia panareensis TaxID=2527978 RepID=A0A517QER8_9PLAN|nr:alpha/beta fold hydrolase [Gimesia panareensis]QDT30139.1 esterase [Gimesia panareensis]QDU53228.1 esterase [Gimesia panareensis]
MNWLFWCLLILIGIELIIQYCIMRAAYPVLFAPLTDRFQLAGTLSNLPEEDSGIRIQSVSFPSIDGLTLRGLVALPRQTPPRGVILFCHPFKLSGQIGLYQCRGLLDAGFAVFTFDFRNHGKSDQDPQYNSVHWLSEHELNDIRAAIRHLRQHPELKQLPLGMLGMCRGAGAALAVAAQKSEIQYVACEGAFINEELFLDHAIRWGERFLPRLFIQLVPTWEVTRAFRIMIWFSQRRQGCRFVNLKPLLHSLKNRQLLFFVGENDQSVVPRMTDLIIRRIQHSKTTPCQLPEAVHNAGRFAQQKLYDQRLIEFFSQMADSHDQTAGSAADKELVSESELVSHQ